MLDGRGVGTTATYVGDRVGVAVGTFEGDELGTGVGFPTL